MAKKSWGGPWTKKKLEAFSKYVWSYLTIMKKFPFWKTIYFDGFAGSGSRKEIKKNTPLLSLFNLTNEEENLYKGAAERVIDLKDNLSFDYYYFIDTDKKALNKLKEKLLKKSNGKKLIFRHDDVNNQLKKLAETLKKGKYVALVFLDPFGMQIKWDSIAQLKGTRSDVWILIPTGVIVNRLLDKKGKLKFKDKLEDFFGLSVNEIESIFYRKKTISTLFNDEEEQMIKITEPIKKIAEVYTERMSTIWKYVTEPLVLKNSTGVPIFHLVFASNNKTAYNIASQIIEKT